MKALSKYRLNVILSAFYAEYNRNVKRKLLGAIAGGAVAENVAKYAQRKGLYVVVQTGDAIALADMPQGFKPREW